MQTNWLLVADEGVARICQWQGSDAHFQDVETLTHASAHAKAADLRRDAQGRRTGHGARSGTSVTNSASLDPEHAEAVLFADRVNEWLADARQAGRFDRLRIVAAPRFLGLLRQSIKPDVAAAVFDEIPKDLVNESRTDLERRFLGEHSAADNSADQLK